MTSTSDPFSAPQLVGYVATIVSLSAYAMRQDKMMKIGVGAGLLLWALHYAMLSGWTASATCLLIASRQALGFLHLQCLLPRGVPRLLHTASCSQPSFG